jgi:urea transport system substrate-binding protein
VISAGVMAAINQGIDQPRELPIASCSLSEPELIEIGPEACDGHVSSSVYFASIGGPRNRNFVEAYRRCFPEAGPTSADTEASYVAVHLLARAIDISGSCKIESVRAAAASVSMDSPQGTVTVDPSNRHCYLTPRIGVSNKAGGFDLLYEATPVKPDPYLVHHDVKASGSVVAPELRVVK